MLPNPKQVGTQFSNKIVETIVRNWNIQFLDLSEHSENIIQNEPYR